MSTDEMKAGEWERDFERCTPAGTRDLGVARSVAQRTASQHADAVGKHGGKGLRELIHHKHDELGCTVLNVQA